MPISFDPASEASMLIFHKEGGGEGGGEGRPLSKDKDKFLRLSLGVARPQGFELADK